MTIFPGPYIIYLVYTFVNSNIILLFCWARMTILSHYCTLVTRLIIVITIYCWVTCLVLSHIQYIYNIQTLTNTLTIITLHYITHQYYKISVGWQLFWCVQSIWWPISRPIIVHIQPILLYHNIYFYYEISYKLL